MQTSDRCDKEQAVLVHSMLLAYMGKMLECLRVGIFDDYVSTLRSTVRFSALRLHLLWDDH